MIKDNKIYKFYEQVKNEANKVVWPVKKELLAMTTVVIVVVLLLSVIFLVLDYGIHSIVQILLNIGK